MSDICFNCNSDMYIKRLDFKDIVEGELVDFSTFGLCCDCGAISVNSNQLNDYYKNRADAYRFKHNLLLTNDFIDIRNYFGFSQEKFAKFLNMDIKIVKRWECGYIQDKYTDNLIRDKVRMKLKKH